MGCVTKDSPVHITLNVIGGKWKPIILWFVKEETIRFGKLHKQIGEITSKMLTQQLRELEHDGLILRNVYPQVPPKVEYSLTKYGETLLPVLESMAIWGKNHNKRLKKIM